MTGKSWIHGNPFPLEAIIIFLDEKTGIRVLFARYNTDALFNF